jgi:hypothetical protein
MTSQPILLVQDNPDEALTLRAFADAVRALGVFWPLLNEPAPSRAPESN